MQQVALCGPSLCGHCRARRVGACGQRRRGRCSGRRKGGSLARAGASGTAWPVRRAPPGQGLWRLSWAWRGRGAGPLATARGPAVPRPRAAPASGAAVLARGGQRGAGEIRRGGCLGPPVAWAIALVTAHHVRQSEPANPAPCASVRARRQSTIRRVSLRPPARRRRARQSGRPGRPESDTRLRQADRLAGPGGQRRAAFKLGPPRRRAGRAVTGGPVRVGGQPAPSSGAARLL